MSNSSFPYGVRFIRYWRGWCPKHGEFKTRVALVGDRLIRSRPGEPSFCVSCAREFANA